MSRGMNRTASMESTTVSRSDLLLWVNGLLQVNLTKVEQCASGAIYCQIIDACNPNSVTMRKVNWMAKAEHEYIPNYKILQTAFDKNYIEKHIDVGKLIRAKYQDNLEFLQWMKSYWDKVGSGRSNYDPMQVREGKPVPPWAQSQSFTGDEGGGNGVPKRFNEKENVQPYSTHSEADTNKWFGSGGFAHTTGLAVVNTPTSSMTHLDNSTNTVDGFGAVSVATPVNVVPQQRNVEINARILAQQDELQHLRSLSNGLQQERNYYFRKLRDVEIFCTELEANTDPNLTIEKVAADVLEILYAENN